MRVLASQHPGYGLEVHKGYGTAGHMAALAKLGPSPIHRLTFAPMKNWDPARAAAAKIGDETVTSATSTTTTTTRAETKKGKATKKKK